MAQIIERKNKSGERLLYIVLFLGYNENTGKKKYNWITFKGNKREARQEADRLQNEVNNKSYVVPTKETVGEYLNRWFTDHVEIEHKATTRESYRGIIDKQLIPVFGRTLLSYLRPKAIRAFKSSALKENKSPRTVRNYLVVLKAMCRYAYLNDDIPTNPAEKVEFPKVEQEEMKYFTSEQAQLLISRAEGTQWHQVFHTALHTGLRRSELVALTWADIDLVGKKLTVSKGTHRIKGKFVTEGTKTSKKSNDSSYRTIHLFPQSVELLKQYKDQRIFEYEKRGIKMKESDVVFVNPDLSQMHPSSISHAWIYHARSISSEFWEHNFHSLRHTHASILIHQGLNLFYISKRLGHSSYKITYDRYGHLLPDENEEKHDQIYANAFGA